MHKLVVLLTLVGAMLAACGGEGGNTTPPINSDSGNSSDASVTPDTDSGTPAPDVSAQPDSSTTPVDVAVIPDAPPQEDVPTTPPADMTPPGEECWSQACGNQWLVTEGVGTAESIVIPCDMNERRIALRPARTGCVATCSGDRCSCVPDEAEDGYSVVVENQREADGRCGAASLIIPMQSGTAMPSTRRLLRRE